MREGEGEGEEKGRAVINTINRLPSLSCSVMD